MKKRIISMLLVLGMVMALLPSMALAANTNAPYSLQYLETIENADYVRYTETDDTDLEDGVRGTDGTLEIYDVLLLYLSADGDWSKIIQPFRDAFQKAGFEETVSKDGNGQNQYLYLLDDQLFLLLGEKASQAIMNESGIVYVQHYRIESSSQPAQTPEPAAETEPATETTNPAAPEDSAVEESEAVAPGLEHFQANRTYSGQFKDVASDAWYADSVAQAYTYGLVDGVSSSRFEPSGSITLASVITIADRLHSVYHTGSSEFAPGDGPWYQVYVDYAKENGIISKDYKNYNAPATRAEFASILAKALPASELAAKNTVPDNSIPDVPSGASYYKDVYLLYRAGVLTGSDKSGKFLPDSSIKRSEAAAILIRMAKPAVRQNLTLRDKVTVYAPDGRSQSISPNQVAEKVSKGWYTIPVTTLYAADGRTKVVPTSKVEAELKVGWYKSKSDIPKPSTPTSTTKPSTSGTTPAEKVDVLTFLRSLCAVKGSLASDGSSFIYGFRETGGTFETLDSITYDPANGSVVVSELVVKPGTNYTEFIKITFTTPLKAPYKVGYLSESSSGLTTVTGLANMNNPASFNGDSGISFYYYDGKHMDTDARSVAVRLYGLLSQLHWKVLVDAGYSLSDLGFKNIIK